MRAELILVVDDDPLCCRMTAAALERSGYRAEWTTVPTMALELVHRRPYTLVVSDVRMPSMLGTTLAAQIMKIRPDLRTLLMTALPDRQVIREARTLGMRLLTKPVAIETLIAAVDDLTHGERPGSPTSP
jgi:DNA-binding NtrC family response regulator